MTEDDTFKALARTPYIELYDLSSDFWFDIRTRDNIVLYSTLEDVYWKFIKDHGWTREEFERAYSND